MIAIEKRMKIKAVSNKEVDQNVTQFLLRFLIIANVLKKLELFRNNFLKGNTEKIKICFINVNFAKCLLE